MRIRPSARLNFSRLRKSLAALAFGLPLTTAMPGLIWPAAAGASETLTYNYDARGRIKTVSHSGTVNNGKVTTYVHDKADNRTSKSTN